MSKYDLLPKYRLRYSVIGSDNRVRTITTAKLYIVLVCDVDTEHGNALTTWIQQTFVRSKLSRPQLIVKMYNYPYLEKRPFNIVPVTDQSDMSIYRFPSDADTSKRAVVIVENTTQNIWWSYIYERRSIITCYSFSPIRLAFTESTSKFCRGLNSLATTRTRLRKDGTDNGIWQPANHPLWPTEFRDETKQIMLMWYHDQYDDDELFGFEWNMLPWEIIERIIKWLSISYAKSF